MCKIPASILFVSEQLPCCIRRRLSAFLCKRSQYRSNVNQYTYGFRIALIVISRTIFASIRFAIPIAPRVQCPVKPAPTYRAHCLSAHFNFSCKIFRACIHFTLILPLFGFLTAAHKYYGFSGTVMLSEAPSLGSASALRYTHLIVYVFPTLFPMLST